MVPEPVTGGVQAAADLPSVSKDGTRLVFRSRLTIVNPVALPFDAEAERLGAPTPLFERTGILNPLDVSPDGQWLALGNFGEQREDLLISRTDGSDLRRLTDDVARDRAPNWSPDGRELAFYSNRNGGDVQIWTIRRDGSRLTQRSDVKGELVIVDADTKRCQRLSARWPFQIADGSVAVAPDGRTIYVGARKVESDIWMVER